MDQNWFEFRDVRKRRFNGSVWIPLRQSRKETIGEYGHDGYREEMFLVTSVAIPLAKQAEATNLGWSDIGFINSHGSYAFQNSYKTAETYQRNEEQNSGVHLVIDQDFGGLEPHYWHLNQDLVVALKLMREGDIWICPNENYVEVARLTRKTDRTAEAIKIRSDFLKDYLAARRMSLRISSFRQRDEISENADHIAWSKGAFKEKGQEAEYEANVLAIHRGGGEPYGSSVAVFHVGRNDIDSEADIPMFDPPNDENVSSASWTVARTGTKLFRIIGKVWRNETVAPSDRSPRVRGDRVPSTCSFIVDAEGTRLPASELMDEDNSRWLWFGSRVVPTLEERRGGSLEWFTRNTGAVAASPGNAVHFGINPKGLINVYAYDVARLPEWQQQIWMGFNVSPNGGVCPELLAAQMAAEPAETQAPEAHLGSAIKGLNDLFLARWGHKLFRPHQDVAEIIKRSNRFRSTDLPSLLALAKDVARLTADSIDTAALQKISPPEKGEKRGSLKSLEKVLATLVPENRAKKIMGPLFGIYDLRLRDAHLAGGEINEQLARAHIDPTASPLEQGLQLLTSTMHTLASIARVVGK